MTFTHGASAYRNGYCRCETCCRGNTVRTVAEKRRRAQRLAEDPALAPHGSAHTYTNWGCRCAPCVAANSARCRRDRLRRLQRQKAVA